jgi:hypothetical protein
MSEEEKLFIRQFKKQLIVYAVIGIFTVAGTSVGFFYNTQFSIEKLTTEQLRLRERQSILESRYVEMGDRKIDKLDYIRELDEVKTLLRDMNQKIDKRNGLQ